MTYACPYEGCDGKIEAKGVYLITEDEVKCPKCERRVEVEHECFINEEGDCIEWLSEHGLD